MMRPSPAHTRTRTLQERLGISQDGSSGVRSTGRHAEEVITDLRQNGDEENEEDDYFNELSSPEIIKRDDFCDNDYDLDLSEDGVERAEVTPAAERLSGGADRFQIYGREQRGSATMSTDMIAEIESRSFDAKPVKEMAIPIESTRQGLPQLFGLYGQTGPLQAQSEVEPSTTEKESQLQSLARDLLSQLKALEITVSSMKATHEKEVEAIHDSYKRVIGLRPAEEKSKVEAMKTAMDAKVTIKSIKRSTCKEIENSVYKFEEDLELMKLLDVADGSRIGSIDEEKRLKRAILRWVGDDERIMTSMRTKMGKASAGSDAYEHIMLYFVKPMVGDGADAEKAFLKVDYVVMFSGTQEMMHSAFDEFVNIVDRLPAGRRGEAADWVQHLSGQVPPDLYTEYDRLLRTLTSSEQRKASEDVETFALYLGKALSKLRSRTPQPPAPVDPPASLSTHEQRHHDDRRGGKMERRADVIPGHPRLVDTYGNEFNTCPLCSFKACPKANNPDGICDVCDEISETRAALIAKGSNIYKEKIDKKRKLFMKAPINYVGMKTSTHAVSCDELSNEAYSALVESLIDEEDDIEAEFSMYKCQMIKDGTYYAKPTAN